MAPSAIDHDVVTREAKQNHSDLPSPIDPSILHRLDQGFIEYYNTYLGVKPSTHHLPIEEVRRYPKKYASPWYRDFTFESFVNDIGITGDDENIIKARVYTPDPRTSPWGSGPYPVHVNVHGMAISMSLVL